MLVTEEIFRAFLKCETKSHLLWSGVVGEQRDFTDWQARQVEAYKQKGLAQPRAKLGEDESLVCEGTPSDFKSAKFSLVIETELQAEGLQAKIHALERVAPSDNKKHSSYLPIRFFPNEKITSQDKLLLAFDALVLASVSGHQPSLGKIIHGAGQKATKVQLPDLIKTAKAIVGKISAQQASPSPPPLILNKHCVECEFKARCRQVAVEKDELSLLSGLNEKERKKQHSKGIFTVTQLSYTYRPRRRPKRLASKPDNYSHALRALAIRENKIHIAGSPKLNITGTPVYLDVEGVPDRDFYYLIGLRIKSGDAYVQHSFWANDASEEKAIWVSFLQALAQIENPQLVHYGSYETTFLKQMKQRYGNAVENGVALDELIKGAVNVLSAIYAQIYFPTYSNSLKEIAPYLGFQWSESKASGLTSLVWRYGWEITEDAGLRKKLVAYNDEDCEALESVSNAVAQLIVQQSQKIGINENDVIYADSMKRENFHRYGDKKLSTPEFDYVNQAAYWNYQREKVYVRSGKRVRQATPKSTRGRSKNLPINKVIESQHPASCPKCGATEFQKREAVSKILFDIKFSQSGVKRW
ncbi:MAG: TM0106 family RecB-like putative nuclease, partial [Acidobacteria bacterium]|nr:TM0106 family RecB-like putative nuclease [Acidobacteriota bacterium]